MLFLIILIPAYLLANYYVVRRMLKWLHSCHNLFGSKWYIIIHVTIYCLLSSTLITVLLFPTGQIQRAIKITSNYWLGTFLYLLLFIVTWDLILLILKKSLRAPKDFLSSRKVNAISGAVIFILVVLFSTYGILHAHDTKVTTYDVTVNKKSAGAQNLKIVLLADLHLGYNMGAKEITNMVNLVNQADPDLVVIAGDIFDNDINALDDPDKILDELNRMQSTYGVYACYGNHDVQEQLLCGFRLKSNPVIQNDSHMNQFLSDAGIHLLSDEVVLINDQFYLAGRKDYSKTLRKKDARKTPEELLKDLDHNKPVFVIDHQPRELDELSKAGADLDLCGHTHDGQLFPGNITVHIAWENAYGLLRKDNMYNIVTSGVGLWGPNMRVGTDSEIVIINLSFQN